MVENVALYQHLGFSQIGRVQAEEQFGYLARWPIDWSGRPHPPNAGQSSVLGYGWVEDVAGFQSGGQRGRPCAPYTAGRLRALGAATTFDGVRAAPMWNYHDRRLGDAKGPWLPLLPGRHRRVADRARGLHRRRGTDPTTPVDRVWVDVFVNIRSEACAANLLAACEVWQRQPPRICSYGRWLSFRRSPTGGTYTRMQVDA